ncbi:hypothetical protein HMPREF0290_1614 [Corynebacterium efficiens YS-314]|nr:hypothetical protein HMPREF0290_1614 [Corynebacterium efficiens YS-314]
MASAAAPMAASSRIGAVFFIGCSRECRGRGSLSWGVACPRERNRTGIPAPEL